PLWSTRTGPIMITPPEIAGGMVYVSQNDRILGYPLDCRGQTVCDQTWSAPTDVYPPVVYADTQVVVGRTVGQPESELLVFPSSCATDCGLQWKAKVAGAFPVAVAMDHLFVGADGGVKAYPIACAADGSECQSSRSTQV